MTKLHTYLLEAPLLNILTTPIIWSCLLPAAILDLVVSIYHGVCFPVNGIPKVKRSDYIIIDRHALPYLNLIEKINCEYCGYFNGLIAYVQEIAARTEQYWCPIRHARKEELSIAVISLFLNMAMPGHSRRALSKFVVISKI